MEDKAVKPMQKDGKKSGAKKSQASKQDKKAETTEAEEADPAADAEALTEEM